MSELTKLKRVKALADEVLGLAFGVDDPLYSPQWNSAIGAVREWLKGQADAILAAPDPSPQELRDSARKVVDDIRHTTDFSDMEGVEFFLDDEEARDRILSLISAKSAREEPHHYSGQCTTCGKLFTDLMMAHLHEEDHGHIVVEDYPDDESAPSPYLERVARMIAEDGAAERNSFIPTAIEVARARELAARICAIFEGSRDAELRSGTRALAETWTHSADPVTQNFGRYVLEALADDAALRPVPAEKGPK